MLGLYELESERDDEWDDGQVTERFRRIECVFRTSAGSVCPLFHRHPTQQPHESGLFGDA